MKTFFFCSFSVENFFFMPMKRYYPCNPLFFNGLLSGNGNNTPDPGCFCQAKLLKKSESEKNDKKHPDFFILDGKALYLQTENRTKRNKLLNIKYLKKMTKADIVNEISRTTGIEKVAVQATVEAFMESIKSSVVEGKNVYLRGFGSFVVKKRAEKTARNISKNVTIKIPEHFIPSFKPSKSFVNEVKDNVKK